MFISRGLSKAEKHYAQIEKEALAVTWACKPLTPYLQGLKFKLETGHKPLVPLLSTKALDELPPRVLRFGLRLMKFMFDRLKTIQEKQTQDPMREKLNRYCKSEWPEKYALPAELASYWPERETLTLAGEQLLRGQMIVIPHSMRQEILNDLHSGHQGIVKCRVRARQSVWWPGLSVHISQLVENCDTCSRQRAEHREPLLTTLAEITHLHIATASTVIAALKDAVGRHGIPETVVSDNGPQYSCELFRDFSTEYGFTLYYTQPKIPTGKWRSRASRSNCERTVERRSLTAAGRKDLRYLSFTQRGWSSRSLKELPRAVRVSCRGWDVLLRINRDDSLAIILPCFPSTSTESRGHPRTELALLTSLSILLLSLSVMLLAQQTIP
ncbi:hypothetical protein L3Q82_001529 [Scortum barcoo]|uniref:Uncharacterized protein n=1 Tax=Scortum barcoo TaxID=214431 RepID=A0ACB8W7R7_9TELE|nr:hypothetical protein L3Q82_001529 [Scortum barcoo]